MEGASLAPNLDGESLASPMSGPQLGELQSAGLGPGVVDSGAGADAEASHEDVARPLDGQSCDVAAGHGQCEAVEAISVTSFIQSLKLPVHDLVTSPPRLRVSCCVDSVSIPRRIVRLAAKTAWRDLKPEVQASKVLLRKWRPTTANSMPKTLDTLVADRFRKTFSEPLLLSAKRESLRELFLPKVRCSGVD